MIGDLLCELVCGFSGVCYLLHSGDGLWFSGGLLLVLLRVGFACLV